METTKSLIPIYCKTYLVQTWIQQIFGYSEVLGSPKQNSKETFVKVYNLEILFINMIQQQIDFEPC